MENKVDKVNDKDLVIETKNIEVENRRKNSKKIIYFKFTIAIFIIILGLISYYLFFDYKHQTFKKISTSPELVEIKPTSKPTTDLSYIQITTGSPNKIVVKNSKEVIVGESFVEGPIENEGEKAGATVTTFYYKQPESEIYKVMLSAEPKDFYSINIVVFTRDADSKSEYYEGELGRKGEAFFIITYDKENIENSKIRKDE